ncbi:MAG: hypothetical protein ACKOBP_04930 [Planctomycetia bacterium]
MHSLSLPGCTRGARRVVVIAMVLALGFAAGRPALGQPPGKLTALDEEEKQGQVVKVGPGILELRLPTGGELWQAMPGPNAKIEVTGKATREMLQAKQFVNCAISLDEFGKLTGPALQVAFTDGGTPGVMAGGLGIAEPGAKRFAGKRPAGSYMLAGTIKQVEGDVVTIIAGREKFDVTVPAEAELLVRSTNVGLAAPGDHVEVEGQYYQRGKVLLSELKIALTKPVEPPPPKNKARRPQ